MQLFTTRFVARWALQGRLLCDNLRTLRSHLSVKRDELRPFLRYIILVEDRLHRAFRDARFAINAFVRMNVEELPVLIKTIDRTYDHAIGVLTIKTWCRDNVCHLLALQVVDENHSIAASLNYNLRLLNRNALAITETELKLIAAAATIGLSSIPKNGYNAPAAIGTPSTL